MQSENPTVWHRIKDLGPIFSISSSFHSNIHYSPSTRVVVVCFKNMNISNPRITEGPAHFNVQSVKEFGLSQTSQASPARTQFEAFLVILRRINI